MPTQTYGRSLVFLTSLFFIFGFLTCMNDILVPHLKALFVLSFTEATLVQFAFFSSYFFFSIPASRFCESKSYPTGMITGLLIAAIGTIGFLASAHFHEFSLFLVSLFILAGGITLIQVAVNPYVSLLGKPETASSRLTIVQAFNSLGTTMAPLIGTAVILSEGTAKSIEKPYIILTLVLVFLAIATKVMKLPVIKTEQKSEEDVPFAELFRNKRLMLGVLGIFMYVGGEVSIGSLLINWIGDPQVKGFPPEVAGNYVAFYWGGAMVGRFLGTPLLARFAPSKVMITFVSAAIAGILLSITTQGDIALWSILSVGFFNSILFPTIFSESITGLSRGAEKASGLLCTAIVGGAIIPLFQGMVADHYSLRVSFLLPVVCYAYLFFFSNYLRKSSPRVE
jgi:MFS transporter, FHS family, L-fucose permease